LSQPVYLQSPADLHKSFKLAHSVMADDRFRRNFNNHRKGSVNKAEILIAALSPIGHVGPLLNVARGLVDRGDQVTVLTAASRAEMIRSVGAKPWPLPPGAHFDETRLDIDNPGRAATSGIKRVNFDIVRLFVCAHEVPNEGADAVRRGHRRLRLLRDPALPAR
jgi:hypothetical protein